MAIVVAVEEAAFLMAVQRVVLRAARRAAPDRPAPHQFAAATCGTIRLKLLKIGAQVRISVRRIKIAVASACPHQAEYHLAYLYLRRAARG